MTQATKQTDTARYDRQLRLWGEEGQACLEVAHLCLLNATATGTECLKNLVLPGIGTFTIVDSGVVTEDDFNNFFVEPAALGTSRAEVACKLLNELNPFVVGHSLTKDPLDLIQNDLGFFSQFSLVIANRIPETPLLRLAQYCWENKIPLVVIGVNGLIGYIRVAVPEHTVVESKPDNPPDDLRITAPWPELVQYAMSFDFDKMDSTQHSHTPYIVVLLQQLDKWKAEHGGQIPSTYAEKSQFRNQVIAGSRKAEEENFNEAYKSALKLLAPVTIPSAVQSILNDPKAINLNEDSTKFWILAAAVREFVANEGGGLLPLSGKLPDMTASTDGYVALQKIYQEKALNDATAVGRRVQALLAKLGKAEDFISEAEVKNFCKNVNFLQCTRYRSLAEEYNPETAKGSMFASELSNPDSNFAWYIVFRAANRFVAQHNRFPGASDSTVQEDTELLKKIVQELLKEMSVASSIADKVRFGGAELHPIAALIGGIASQEIIKLITHQFTPLNNTFVFNGMESTSVAFEA